MAVENIESNLETSQPSHYLQDTHPRARWVRADTVRVIKRFFFCERALVLGKAGFLPRIASFQIKTQLPRFIWHDSLTADALRQRVFELRYPNRTVEHEGNDLPLVTLLGSLGQAPSAAALLLCLGESVIPALLDSYREYLNCSDSIADGPTHRFLAQACAEKQEQLEAVRLWAKEELLREPDLREEAVRWTTEFAEQLADLGNIGAVVGTALQIVKGNSGASRMVSPRSGGSVPQAG